MSHSKTVCNIQVNHNFLPWEFLLIKMLEIQKTKTSEYTTFKTDKSGLSLFDFQLF